MAVSREKVVPHDSKSDLPLVIKEILGNTYDFSSDFSSIFSPFLSMLVNLHPNVLRFFRNNKPYLGKFKEINYGKSVPKLRNKS